MAFSDQESNYDQDLNLLANSIKLPFTGTLRAPARAKRNTWSAGGQSPRSYSPRKAWPRSDRITVMCRNVLITWNVSNHSGLRRSSWDIAVTRKTILWLNNLPVLECLVDHGTILSKPPKSCLDQAGERKPLPYWAKKRFWFLGDNLKAKSRMRRQTVKTSVSRDYYNELPPQPGTTACSN